MEIRILKILKKIDTDLEIRILKILKKIVTDLEIRILRGIFLFWTRMGRLILGIHRQFFFARAFGAREHFNFLFVGHALENMYS